MVKTRRRFRRKTSRKNKKNPVDAHFLSLISLNFLIKPKKENKKVVHDPHLCLKKIPTKWVEDEAQTRPNLVFKI